MTSTIVAPSLQQILIEDECAKAVINLATTTKSDIDSLSSVNGFVQNSGFVNRTTSSIAFDDSSQVLTLTPTATSYPVILGGNRISIAATKTASWGDSEGLHYFYMDSAGTLTCTQVAATFLSQFTSGGAAVAAIYWDAANNQSIRRIDERHGVEMPGATHVYLHRYFGAQYESGGALGNFTITGSNATLATHAQFSVADAVVADEDIRFTIANGAPQTLSTAARIPIFYLSGSGDGVWRRKTADAYPLIYSGTAGYTGTDGARIPWNQYTGGAWQLTEVTSGNYVMVHYFLTTDLVEPVIGVQGQADHASLSGVRAAANTEISTIIGMTKLLSTEKKPLATVIFQSATVYSNVPKAKVVQTDTGTNYEDWRLERSLPV